MPWLLKTGPLTNVYEPIVILSVAISHTRYNQTVCCKTCIKLHVAVQVQYFLLSLMCTYVKKNISTLFFQRMFKGSCINFWRHSPTSMTETLHILILRYTIDLIFRLFVCFLIVLLTRDFVLCNQYHLQTRLTVVMVNTFKPQNTYITS